MDRVCECLALMGLMITTKAFLIPVFGSAAVWLLVTLAVLLIWHAYTGIRILLGSLRP